MITLSRTLTGLALFVALAPGTFARSEAATAITTVPTTINQPGRYYLTQDFTVQGGIAIFIESSNVILDFCGFTVDGDDQSQIGVFAFDNFYRNITVMNGEVVGFESGIVLPGNNTVQDMMVRSCSSDGVRLGIGGRAYRIRTLVIGEQGLTMGPESIVEDCRISGGGAGAVLIGTNSLVHRLHADGGTVALRADDNVVLSECYAENFDSIGIRLGAGGTVKDASVKNSFSTGAPVGIELGAWARAIDCFVDDMDVGIAGGDGSCVTGAKVVGCREGIVVGAAASVDRCTVSDSSGDAVRVLGDSSRVSNTVVRTCAGVGILLIEPASVVVDCRVTAATVAGITVGESCVAERNVVQHGAGVGLLVTGATSRVEHNTIHANAMGIVTQAPHALLAHNRVTGSVGADFTFAPRTIYAPFLTTSSLIPGSYPQANFATPLF